MSYDNTNKGTLGRNDRATSDSHPSHKGSINIEGVEYWLSAWVKESARGKFFSLSVKPKDPALKGAAGPKVSFADDLSDEIPFAPEVR